jgi:hypothetical protein
MANQPESTNYDAGVYQLEVTDPVRGGVGGIDNAPLLNLANRTNWLKSRIDAFNTAIALLAAINSPTFTGTPAGPTAALDRDDTMFATTQWVINQAAGVVPLVSARVPLIGTSLRYARADHVHPWSPGRWLAQQRFTAPGVIAYVPTVGTNLKLIEVIGGGGGGAGAHAAGAGNASAGIPGNGGTYAFGWLLGSAGATLTIGAGGAAGNDGDGGNGGTSAYGGFLACPGGPGGSAGFIQAGSASGGNGNLSGPATGTPFAYQLGGICSPSFGFTTGQVAFGGNGGPSFYGPGGLGVPANINGGGANSSGSGGGGTFGSQNTLPLIGGGGGGGEIRITEFS